MDHEKQILNYVSGRNWTWIAGIVLLLAGVLMLSSSNGILILLGIVVLFVGMYYLLRALTVDLPAINRAKRCVARLRENGMLDYAAQELAASTGKGVGRDETLLTQHYFFGHHNGAAGNYRDIIWAYKRRFTQRMIGIPVKTVDSLMISTGGKEFCLVNMGKRDKQNELDGILTMIHEKNPDALIGYTPENKKRCKELSKG